MSALKRILEAVDRLDADSRGGLEWEYQPIPGEVEVIQVNIKGREELPIYLTASDSQLLCICYLWAEDEVLADKRQALMEAMLDTNVPMPLSSFARVDQRYVVFGAMSLKSNERDVALEIATLSDNAIDAIESFAAYLK